MIKWAKNLINLDVLDFALRIQKFRITSLTDGEGKN